MMSWRRAMNASLTSELVSSSPDNTSEARLMSLSSPMVDFKTEASLGGWMQQRSARRPLASTSGLIALSIRSSIRDGLNSFVQNVTGRCSTSCSETRALPLLASGIAEPSVVSF
eukprot:scaffold361_cov248-Pinguiococcus_pyrenoidosus.AAC.24